MRRSILALTLVVVVAGSFALGRYTTHSQSGRVGRHIAYYVDPMHPSYKSDKPGIAPDCGMQLVPVYSTAAESEMPAAPLTQASEGAVSIDPGMRRSLGITVVAAKMAPATRTIRVIGRVAPEDTQIYHLNSGLDGFIRETYGDSVGTQVKKGQKLASYYAPDFLAAASGFLAATERIPGSVGKDGARFTPDFGGPVAKEGVRSIQGYTDHLRNLGMSDQQIAQIAESRQLPQSIDIVAPADGFILTRNVSPGLHFDHMLEFYQIADLQRVWVIADVFEPDSDYLTPGRMARLTLRDGHQLSARVTDSLPQSEAGGGTVKVRLEADNPELRLRPDMLVDVEVSVSLPPAVTVPLDALIDSGAYTRVYVEHSDGVFEPREVATGWRSGENVEIRKGIQPGERVVASGTFLVDSESRLKPPQPAATAMAKADNKAESMHGMDQAAARPQ